MTRFNSLGPPRCGRKVETEEECLRKLKEEEERARETIAGGQGTTEVGSSGADGSTKPTEIVPEFVVPSGIDTVIESCEGFWRFRPVVSGSQLYVYSLQKSLVDGGSEKTLRSWAVHSKIGEKEGRYVAASGEAIFSIINFLYTRLDDPQHSYAAKEAWEWIGKVFRNEAGNKSPPILLSKCVYNPDPEQDEVIHDYKRGSQKVYEGKLWGEPGELASVADGDMYSFLTLGRIDNKHCHRVLEKLIGKPPRVGRFNSRYQHEIAGPLIIGLEGNGALEVTTISALDTTGPAFGVWKEQIFPRQE